MKQGIQSTLKTAIIKSDGCYFLCLLRWAEVVSGKEIDERQIGYLYDRSVELEYMRKDCLILMPHQVINLALSMYVYSSANIVSRVPESFDNPFITYLTKPGFGHFIFNYKNVTWDPLDPNRPSAQGYVPTSYRIIT